MSYDNKDEDTITINNNCNNALKYFPKVKSNFELVSNLSYDIKEILYKGCGYLPNLLCETEDLTLFTKLNNELLFIDTDNIQNQNIINWSKHYKIENPTISKTFNNIIDCLQKYFKIKVLATRINYYTYDNYKPLHHDAHSFSNGDKENITIGLSLGDSRNLIFKHVESSSIFSFPQNNGDVFYFDYLTNKKFQHGISKNTSKNTSNLNSKGRISIILWGNK